MGYNPIDQPSPCGIDLDLLRHSALTTLSSFGAIAGDYCWILCFSLQV